VKVYCVIGEGHNRFIKVMVIPLCFQNLIHRFHCGASILTLLYGYCSDEV